MLEFKVNRQVQVLTRLGRTVFPFLSGRVPHPVPGVYEDGFPPFDPPQLELIYLFQSAAPLAVTQPVEGVDFEVLRSGLCVLTNEVARNAVEVVAHRSGPE